MYPVQFRIDEGNFAIRLAEIRDWLSRRRIDPARLHYRMAPDYVRLRIEFAKPHDADAFRTEFKPHLQAPARVAYTGERKGQDRGQDNASNPT